MFHKWWDTPDWREAKVYSTNPAYRAIRCRICIQDRAHRAKRPNYS